MENLWEITNFNDLIKLLRTSINKFVVLAITLKDTENPLKKKLKKIIKTNSKICPKLLFLYYQASDTDLGRVDPLLNDIKNDYPKLYYIYNTQEIWSSVLGIDLGANLENFFSDICKHYNDGSPLPQEPEQPNIKNTDNSLQVQSPPITHEYPKKDLLLEKQKYDEKIELLRQIQKKCKENFIKECKVRKENEETKINTTKS